MVAGLCLRARFERPENRYLRGVDHGGMRPRQTFVKPPVQHAVRALTCTVGEPPGNGRVRLASLERGIEH